MKFVFLSDKVNNLLKVLTCTVCKNDNFSLSVDEVTKVQSLSSANNVDITNSDSVYQYNYKCETCGHILKFDKLLNRNI
jgi:hypothetical protein